MKFSEFEYVRPEIESFTLSFKSLLEDFKTSESFQEQDQCFAEINSLKQEFYSMYNICHIRHTVDTRDKFYEDENNYFDQNTPSFSALNSEFYKALINSPYKEALEKKWGKQLFMVAELALKTFKPTILEHLQEENKLCSEYVKLKAKAKIHFRGEEYNLSSLLPQEISIDRETRKAATEAKWKFYEEISPKSEEIYQKQVKVRNEIALKLGYKNFVETGYARMNRTDYSAVEVANFRKQVQEIIVPIATSLYERQRKRLNLDTLYYYDEDFRFASGNPKPQGSHEWIINNAAVMYKELSNDTNVFFNFMQDKQLMNLVNKEGKATGGYCTFIGKYKAPYIFSNFNGTSGDIDVLTHEAGHAFQVFSSRDIGINEYNWPTNEACEIHSMSMEFFTWPWMELFFKGDTDKYKFSHLSSALLFLPYGVAVDEFQHFVYENPTISIEERNAAWRTIEKKYLPHRNYGGNEFLENGGYWQRQSHIFTAPFYYIDYTLAQICAFQFWIKDRKNHQEAWTDYVRLCKAGGSLSFLELVKLANLNSPFKNGCVESAVLEIKEWLDQVDDTKF